MSDSRTLVLLGGGGHAAVVADAARSSGWIIGGCLDDGSEQPRRPGGLRRLGAIEDLGEVLATVGPGPHSGRGHPAVGDPQLRERWLDALGSAVAPAIVHATAAVSPSAELAEGVFVGPNAVVNARAVVERGAIVNSGAIVEHDCVLEAFCHVAPGAALGGGASLGRAGLVGINAAVLPGVRIGASATLGAGAVAADDVPDGATAVGIPARPQGLEACRAKDAG